VSDVSTVCPLAASTRVNTNEPLTVVHQGTWPLLLIYLLSRG